MVAIIIIVVFAYFFPQWGAGDSPVPLDTIGTIGVSLIFFFYGLKLSRNRIVDGLRNWKLHVLVQTSTFLFFPLTVLLFYPLVHTAHSFTIWLGFLFLAALPSTVSSSVVMVSVAKGNVPAAIFNASISGLIGIAVTPLWMGVFLEPSGRNFELDDVYVKLLTEILLPVVAGILLQRFLGKYAQQYGRQLSMFDKSVILLIIYKSFAESFEQRLFSTVDLMELLLIAVGSLTLFITMYFATGFAAQVFGFSHEDRITAQYCGTKKSLVHGTVFSKILFHNMPTIGILLLPLMLFHAMQIFIISVVASRTGAQKNEHTHS